MNISTLRELIRAGEHLGGNLDNWESSSSNILFQSEFSTTVQKRTPDTELRGKWIYDVKFFVRTLDRESQNMVFHELSAIGRHRRDTFEAIMGFLRSLYNQDTSQNKPLAARSQAVFIVHGHDDSMIADVKRCIEELGLTPIVLREQPDKGKTIIEKLEDWLGNCKCAIVLYSPCDVGRAVNSGMDEERARQNVVYEHGLFQGYLGRNRIMILRKGNTVVPGDCSGVVYNSVDGFGWQEKLKKDILAIDSQSFGGANNE